MDSRKLESQLDQDLRTIKECEADSWNYDTYNENDLALDFDHVEIRSHQETKPIFEEKKNIVNSSPLNSQQFQSNIFGSRTYTSPGSFDSSSLYSHAFKSDFNKTKAYNMQQRKFTNRNSNSIVTKLRSDSQSDKFTLLRNVVENINDPHKRKILLDFLNQSAIKTEYVTMRESSSSGEEVKGLRKINQLPKRRHKSPLSVLPTANLSRKRRDTNVFSEERRRFSLAQPRLQSVAVPEQLQIHNFVIEKKNGSDEFDSKNGDKWFTEESKEVPLEAILERFQNYQNPFQQQRVRAASGYSASLDETTNIEGQFHEIDSNYIILISLDLVQIYDMSNVSDSNKCKLLSLLNRPIRSERLQDYSSKGIKNSASWIQVLNYDNELVNDLEDNNKGKRQEIIVFPGDMRKNFKNTGKNAKKRLI